MLLQPNLTVSNGAEFLTTWWL